MNAPWSVIVVGVLCGTGVELFALNKGIDGIALSLYMAMLSGIIGFNVKAHIDRKGSG